jgi:outer membrane protein assembly factor BamD (BamD/ComL family)
MQALYELGLLKISQWRQQQESNPELKKKYLAQTRAILTSFITLYPNSFYVEQVKKNLENLPKVE